MRIVFQIEPFSPKDLSSSAKGIEIDRQAGTTPLGMVIVMNHKQAVCSIAVARNTLVLLCVASGFLCSCSQTNKVEGDVKLEHALIRSARAFYETSQDPSEFKILNGRLIGTAKPLVGNRVHVLWFSFFTYGLELHVL